MSFEGRVVLVTGASSGIGAATAVHFAKLGASLTLTGRNVTNLNKVADQCRQVSNRDPFVVAGDIAVESDVQNLLESSIKHYGKLDVLVNNAGVAGPGSIEDTDLAQYDLVMNTNLRSVYQLMMLAVPHLIKTKGNIVNVSSVNGIRAFPNVLAYCVSKAALDQLTRCTALELASKQVRVNSVNPGFVVTDLHRRAGMDETTYAAFVERCIQTHPMQKVGKPEEIAAAIVFLASDAASNSTGVTLSVDGGKHALCPR